MTEREYTATVYWTYPGDGKVELRFVNHRTGYERRQTYQSKRTAKAAETRFLNSIGRLKRGRV